MTDEEKASLLALLISDIPGNPYYPIFTAVQYGQFLMMAKGSVERAVVPAAISASMIIGSDYTREVIGDLQLASSSGSNYLKALEMLIKNKGKSLPDGLMPWSASVPSYNKLLEFARCDHDDPRFMRPVIAPAYEQWVRDLDKGLKDVNAEVDAVELTITSQGESITSLTSRVVTSEADIVELKATDAEQDETLTAQAQAITSLTSSIDRQTNQTGILESKATQFTVDITDLNTKTTNTNNTLTSLTARVATVENEIVELKVVDQKLELGDLYGGDQ